MSRRASSVAVVALLCACGAARRPAPAPARSTTEDLLFAGRLEEAAVSATRELAGARPGSIEADRAIFVLDYASAILPRDIAGEMALFTQARRKVQEAATPGERDRALEAIRPLAAPAPSRPPFRAGLIHLALALTLQGSVAATDARLLAHFDAAAAAFAKAGAPRWHTFTSLQQLFTAMADPIVAAQPRTSLRIAELGRIGRAQNAPVLEALAFQLEGNALQAQRAGEGSAARYAAARKIFLEARRFDRAAEMCAEELFVLSPNADAWAAGSLRGCLGITEKIANPNARTFISFRLVSSTFLCLMRSVAFRSMSAGISFNTERRIRLTDIESALAGQAVEIGAGMLRDSTARGEGLPQQLAVRMLMTGLLSMLARDAEAIEVLSSGFDQVAASSFPVQGFTDALIAYAASLEHLGRADQAADAYQALAKIMCTPGYDGQRRGPELYFRAGRAWIHAAGLPPSPQLPAFNGAPTSSRPWLEQARGALRAGLACKPLLKPHLVFFLLAADVALGDDVAAEKNGRQYVKEWDRDSLEHNRELPSPLELLPPLIAALPPSAALSAELQKRKARLAERKPYLQVKEPDSPPVSPGP